MGEAKNIYFTCLKSKDEIPLSYNKLLNARIMAVFHDKRNQTLWMGDLEPEMDETFIATAFLLIQEPIVACRIIKNRLTGDPAGYCFVEFADEEQAQRVLLRLNGKLIPGNMHPPRRFKLNPSSKPEPGEEYSVFVGDLTDDVDDYDLYKTFKDRYPSTRGAKVVLETNGESRGFGFVRFSNSFEQTAALREMQFFQGLGGRPIRVSSAMPKRPFPGASCATNLATPLPPMPNQAPIDNAMNVTAISNLLASKDTFPQLQQQWLQYYQQWQQFYINQAQWAQLNQNPNSPEKKKTTTTTTTTTTDVIDLVSFDVDEANRHTLQINQDFDDEMHESQWFSQLLRL